jgi:STE24 endopeptidase
MPALALTLTFLLFVLASSVARLWLSGRQVRHVIAHRAQVPTQFAESVDLTAHQKAADYTVARNRLVTIDVMLGAAVLLGFTVMGGLQWLNEYLLGIFSGPSIWQQLALLFAVSAISGVIDLPLSWYRQFRLEQAFGFNRMTLRDWLIDLVKGTAIGTVIALPLAALVIWLMQSTGSYWWLWAWLAWAAFSLIMMVLAPTVIAPLFNKFKAMPDGALKTRLDALLKRCGFTAQGLYVMDGSRRSAHANAYFTGLGSSRRIVLYDTLIEQLSEQELEAVLAHEIGHYQRKHINKRLVLTMGLGLLAFALLGWLAQQPWFFQGLGVTSAQPPGAALTLLLFFFALPPVGFFIAPLMSRWSRAHEFEADAYAAEHCGAEPLVQALLKLYRDNASTLTPDALHSAFYDSHPNAAERIGHLRSIASAYVKNSAASSAGNAV